MRFEDEAASLFFLPNRPGDSPRGTFLRDTRNNGFGLLQLRVCGRFRARESVTAADSLQAWPPRQATRVRAMVPPGTEVDAGPQSPTLGMSWEDRHAPQHSGRAGRISVQQECH
jgi:hypothetical protein